MKRLIVSTLAALAAFAAQAATLVPVGLMNPAGSTAGQTIVSQGASVVPVWAKLTAANVTGAAATASPLSQFASTTSAQLAGVISDETGSGALVFGTSPTITTPTITTPTIVGTATNNNAAAGSVGEFVTATSSSVSMAANTSVNVASVSLTAGDWDVWGTVQFVSGATTIGTGGFNCSVSTTSGTAGSQQGGMNGVALAAGAAPFCTSPAIRLSLSATTTVYIIGAANYSGTATGNGYIAARRRR